MTPDGQCAASVASASGDTAFIYECDEFADDQEWEWIPRDIDDAMVRVRSTNLCLRAASAGGDATVVTCNVNSSTQRWKMRSVMVRGWGGMCLHLENGNTNGGLVTSRRCNGGDANQRWTFWFEIGNGFGRIRFGNGSTAKCLQLGTTNGSQATVVSCASTNAQIFFFDPTTHQIKRTGTGINKCLDVQGVTDADYILGIGQPADGAKVQAFDCLTAQYPVRVRRDSAFGLAESSGDLVWSSVRPAVAGSMRVACSVGDRRAARDADRGSSASVSICCHARRQDGERVGQVGAEQGIPRRRAGRGVVSRLSTGHVVMIVAGLLGVVLTLSVLRSADDARAVLVAADDVVPGTVIEAGSVRTVRIDADDAVMASLYGPEDLDAIEGSRRDRIDREGFAGHA